MQKSISTLPFTGTPEQEQQLLEVIEQHKNEKGALMPIMQKAQDIYGYLPVEVQQIIAEQRLIFQWRRFMEYLPSIHNLPLIQREDTQFPYVLEPPVMLKVPEIYLTVLVKNLA